MTKTLTPEQQLHTTKQIIEQNLETAIRLNALVRSKMDNNLEPIAPQHIKQDVEAVCGVVTALAEILTGKVEFHPNPATEYGHHIT